MENATLCQKLVDYIYQYADHLKTEKEKLAGKTILYYPDAVNEKMLTFLKSKGWYSDDEEVKAMIADGYESFKVRVVQRIYDQHKKELNLNLCPKCNGLARTPLAKQCRHCYHDWH
jgi:hypothetical protein